MPSFLTIDGDIRTYGHYVESAPPTRSGNPSRPHRALIVGNMLTGSASALTTYPITRASDADTLFGRGSVIAEMIRAWRAANTGTELLAMGVADDAGGVAAAGSILFAGTATESRTLPVYVGGRRVAVGVTVGDTAEDVAAAVVAALTAEDMLLATAAVNGVTVEQVDITARNKGEHGNAIDIRIAHHSGERLPSGITATITAMSGGATDPDTQDILDVIGDQQYHTIVIPWASQANLTLWTTEMTRRWGGMIAAYGSVFTGLSGTLAAMTTIGGNNNSRDLVLVGGGKSPTVPWYLAAATAGLDASDAGRRPCNRPRQTLAIPGALAPSEGDQLTREERQLLLTNGVTALYADSFGALRIDGLFTSYQLSDGGVADRAWESQEIVRAIQAMRYDWTARVGSKYSRHLKAADGARIPAGVPIATPKDLAAEAVAQLRAWEDEGLVHSVDQYKDMVLAEADASDPYRINLAIPAEMVVPLRVTASQIQPSF